MSQTMPTTIVILGVTGDLTAKKIMPALFNLYKKGILPDNFNIVGFGRREMGQLEFTGFISEMLNKKLKPSASDIKDFSQHLSYVHGLFEDKVAYNKLSEHLESLETADAQRLFYLAVPPEIYETIFSNLDATDLGHGGSKKVLTKILVEKPFGFNSETAEKLDKLLGTLFQEHQIYRIDHYLAKEMVQNILTFRFSNDLFEKIWSNKFIDKIEIRTWETLGVEQRGAFYDAVGTLRDVGQNHLLQLLALTTMDTPLDFSSQAIQLKRAQLMETLKPLTLEGINNQTFRAQYDGFKNIQGVKENSNTETFFKIKTELFHNRWHGVPVYMEAGKRMAEQVKDVIVTFKHEENCICPPGQHYTNRIIFSMEPEESITLEFWAKKPGLDNVIEKRTMDFMLRKNSERTQYVEEYEKLLLDAIKGDQTLFVSTSEVKSMWAFIDPIVRAWQNDVIPLNSYKPESNPKPQLF
ncbi:MAG: glucose-6-phosphate dehydrogenase [Candidatus Doudnabacteria bacterium]|nr:glucose-6-phosphate dehydrogenase [Candidatus Doudnabacteria bacterium]